MNDLWNTKYKNMTKEEKNKARRLYYYANTLMLYYDKFKTAKNQTDFVKKGWYINLDKLSKYDDVIPFAGVSHNDLLKAAKEYQDNNGADTDFTKDFENRIQELKLKLKNNPNKMKLIWKILIIAFFVFLLIGLCSNDEKPQPASTTSAEINEYKSYLSEKELAERDTYLKGLISLYLELQAFKDNPEFLNKKFAYKTAAEWKAKVDNFSNRYKGINTFQAGINVVAGDMVMLASTYESYNRTKNTDDLKYIKYMENEFNLLIQTMQEENK